MSNARTEFATRLNGRSYGNEISKAECLEARDKGLLVVFGASDDLTKFRGIFEGEEDVWGGSSHVISRKKGRWQVQNIDDLPKTKGVIINAEWVPEGFGSWLISPFDKSIPYSHFDIMSTEDRTIYCRGAVFDEADLTPKQYVRGIGRDAENEHVLIVSFAQTPTDDDFRSVHDYLKEWTR